MSTDQIGQPLVAQLPAERIRRKVLGELMPISQTPSGKSAGFSEQSLRNVQQFFSSYSIRSAPRSELAWTDFEAQSGVHAPVLHRIRQVRRTDSADASCAIPGCRGCDSK